MTGDAPTLKVADGIDFTAFMSNITNISATSGSALIFETAAAEEVFDEAGTVIHSDLLTPSVKYTLTIAATGYKDSELTYFIPATENEEETIIKTGEAPVGPFGYTAKVEVSTDKDGKIIKVVDNGTEPGNNSSFWSDAKDIFVNLVGKTASEIDDVDVISGATVSSNAIKEAVKNALN